MKDKEGYTHGPGNADPAQSTGGIFPSSVKEHKSALNKTPKLRGERIDHSMRELRGHGIVCGQKLWQPFKRLFYFKLTKKYLPTPVFLAVEKKVSQSRVCLYTSHTSHSQGCASAGENVRHRQVGVKAKQMFAF